MKKKARFKGRLKIQQLQTVSIWGFKHGCAYLLVSVVMEEEISKKIESKCEIGRERDKDRQIERETEQRERKRERQKRFSYMHKTGVYIWVQI